MQKRVSDGRATGAHQEPVGELHGCPALPMGSCRRAVARSSCKQRDSFENEQDLEPIRYTVLPEFCSKDLLQPLRLHLHKRLHKSIMGIQHRVSILPELFDQLSCIKLCIRPRGLEDLSLLLEGEIGPGQRRPNMFFHQLHHLVVGESFGIDL